MKRMKPNSIITLTAAMVLGVSSHVVANAQETLMLSQSQCREMAIAYSEDMQIADNAVRQAELDKKVAFTSYLPNFSGSLMVEYMSDIDMSGTTLQMRGMYMAGIAVTQPIYVGGKINAGNKLAKIGIETKQEQQRQTRMEVIADADNAYWSLISVHSKVEMLRAYQQQMDTLYNQVKTGMDAGMSTMSDMLQVEANRSDITYQLQKAQNGENLCRLALCNVLGISFDTNVIPTDTLTFEPAQLSLSDDISSRPELALLEKQVEANEQQIRTTRADFLPQIALQAGWTYYDNLKMKGSGTDENGNSYSYSQTMNGDFLMALLSVSVPLFHWGEGVKKVNKVKLDGENARLELEKNTRLLTIEVQQAILNVTDSYRLVEAALDGLKQANENLRVMNDRYQVGMSALSDLLDAQSLWRQAASNLIEAQTQLKINETEYLRVTGQLN